ncbi:MAG: three-Cys-motif partner protein TcmP, partial [Erysipelotrichia bacterium]|nr:three-Cys-motif partner protein TcmP [Erysipelotrichia bacterium]
MGNEGFFNESTEQSIVKARIVKKYFDAWSKVIVPRAKSKSGRLAYIDFFAGPGRYKDGKKSTPLLILESAIRDDDLSNMLVTVFNDKDIANTDSLRKAIFELPGVERLKYKPIVRSDEVGENIVQMFETKKTVPTLFFIDPWGYKGLSLRLINAVIKDWGCDCIFFFNYNRINMGLNNPLVEEHMNALFGIERADILRTNLINMSPYEREMTIVEKMVESLKEKGGNFVLPFGFKNDSGIKTSHHLFFVSKNFTAYEIMKEIMAKESTESDQGVASFQYNLVNQRWPILFELSRP